MLGIVTGNDKNQLGFFRRKHLMVIGIGPGCAEKAGTTRGPLQVEVADRHQVHRREGKSRIDVPECMPAGADETDTQFTRVLVVVSNVQDTEDFYDLFADGLAVRRAKNHEEERFRLADVGGSMPDIRWDGDRVSRFHFGFRPIGHGVADISLNHDENLTAVRVIMTRIAAAGIKAATTHRKLAAVTERTTGVPSEVAPIEIELFRFFGGE
jgi:hypothetical protein